MGCSEDTPLGPFVGPLSLQVGQELLEAVDVWKPTVLGERLHFVDQSDNFLS